MPQQKSGVTSQTSLTASTNRVVDASTESRPDSESVDAELVPSRLRKSGLRNRKKGKLKVNGNIKLLSTKTAQI